jgi:hypothetical protein
VWGNVRECFKRATAGPHRTVVGGGEATEAFIRGRGGGKSPDAEGDG